MSPSSFFNLTIIAPIIAFIVILLAYQKNFFESFITALATFMFTMMGCFLIGILSSALIPGQKEITYQKTYSILSTPISKTGSTYHLTVITQSGGYQSIFLDIPKTIVYLVEDPADCCYVIAEENFSNPVLRFIAIPELKFYLYTTEIPNK